VRNGGFATGAWVAAVIVASAFYAVFAYVRTVNERAVDGPPAPAWTRYALPISIVVFLLASVAIAWLAPAWFGGVILGGCIGVTIAFQVRRPRRPMPPSRPASGPPSSDASD
jgi:small-conductance mechanosensitive channel